MFDTEEAIENWLVRTICKDDLFQIGIQCKEDRSEKNIKKKAGEKMQNDVMP